MLLDIAPTLAMYQQTGDAFARAYWHWFFLIQPPPLPEALIDSNPARYVRSVMGSRHAGLAPFDPAALAEYERCFGNPDLNEKGWSAAIHSACEDYRASATIDLVHDREGRERGDKLACDTLVMWGERGVVNRMFKPVELWQAQCAGRVQGHLMPAGHFIPEELPEATCEALTAFMV